MKKIIVLVLVSILLCLCITGCDTRKIIGTWNYTEDEISMDFTFKSGNKGVVTVGDVEYETAWQIEDGELYLIMNNDGETQTVFEDAPYTIDGDKLTVTYEDQTFVFHKK